MSTQLPTRTLALLFPDWEVTAYALSAPALPDPAEPIAIVHANTVVACSATAREAGVRVGMRRRDAQAACPHLRIAAADPARDARMFLPLVATVEALAPGVQIARPGLAMLRARGPARYYGGEQEAALVLLSALADAGHPEAQAGIADGPFTAEQAAASGAGTLRIVPAGDAAAFLAPLPVTVLGDASIADMLARLGVHTLAQFAALDPLLVRDRLAQHGARLHALAAGADSRPVVPRVVPAALEREIAFEPPLELAEQVAFAVRTTADEVIAALAAVSLVCTEVRIQLSDDRGGMQERLWLHPTCFDAAAIVDRIRWQLEALWQTDDPVLHGAVAMVRIMPETVDDSAHHQPGLFGHAPDERLHHALSRVQGMLGHRSVLVPAIGGGRMLHERQVLVPWGERIVFDRDPDRPWPGHLPDPLPTTVFTPQPPVQVLDADGALVLVDERSALSAVPATLVTQHAVRALLHWSGPWPVHERTWDRRTAAHRYRFQLVTAEETAWLVVFDGTQWQAEGRYD